jgi:uncharacterized protein YwgA
LGEGFLNSDFLLAVLGSMTEIEGRKRFQKVVFLLKAEKGLPISYDFIPYLHGPYSSDMQMDLNILCIMGLVREEHEGVSYRYSLTREANAELKKARKRLGREFSSRIDQASKEYILLSTPDLVTRAKGLLSSGASPTRT